MLQRLTFILLLFAIAACGEEGPTEPTPEFDRQAMLINWADNLILPGISTFAEQTETLKTAAADFAASPNQNQLDQVRTAWLEAYLGWQSISMFEIGKAEELRFRDQLNIYPVNVIEVEENIQTGTYDLSLPSQNDRQGFPALDFLLHGLGNTDDEILSFYTTHPDAASYSTYLTELTARIDALTDEVLADWNGGYRDDFVNNSGNSANSSVDKLVNDYLFYYEKSLRAGKVGIPAGVFSGSPLSTHVEAPYRQDISKTLLLAALDASQDFFNGKYLSSNTTGQSLKSYLDFLNTMKESADLSAQINAQFDAARSKINLLDDNFVLQISLNNILLLEAYDQLQLNVVLMKVDMLQALNINVDFVDADGD